MPKKCLNILIAGGYDINDPHAFGISTEKIINFASCLGKEVILQGHNIISGCQTDLDKVVAEAALEILKTQGLNEKEYSRIISYVLQDNIPAFNCGTILQSDRKDWDIDGLLPTPPEVIKYADVVILLGGFYGTFKAANWARIDRKPLLPFASFGGAAKEVYKVEANRFDQIYEDNVSILEYDKVLKSLSADWDDLARDTVALAEKIVTTRSVFVVMSFKDEPYYKDLYRSIQNVCKEFDYTALRVDESNLHKRIIPEITRQVKQSAFVIADVTEHKPNVFYELGFADGVGKEVVLTAKEGTELPFDIHQ